MQPFQRPTPTPPGSPPAAGRAAGEHIRAKVQQHHLRRRFPNLEVLPSNYQVGNPPHPPSPVHAPMARGRGHALLRPWGAVVRRGSQAEAGASARARVRRGARAPPKSVGALVSSAEGAARALLGGSRNGRIAWNGPSPSGCAKRRMLPALRCLPTRAPSPDPRHAHYPAGPHHQQERREGAGIGLRPRPWQRPRLPEPAGARAG
jgi:hypothetical protein